MANEARFKGITAVALAFALGVAAGGGMAFGFAQHRYSRLLEDRPGFVQARRVAALSRRLGLDDSQRERVGSILARRATERGRLEREMFDKCGEALRAEQTATEGELRAVLTPDQQRRFDEVSKRREHFFRGR